MQTGTEGSCLVGPCSHLLACGRTFSWHRKTDQGLPVANANFMLNWNKPILKKTNKQTHNSSGFEEGLENIGKKIKKSYCATFLSSLVNLGHPTFGPRNYSSVWWAGWEGWCIWIASTFFSSLSFPQNQVSDLMNCLARSVLTLSEGMQQLETERSGADGLSGLRVNWKCTLNCEQRAKLWLCCHTHAYLLKGHLHIQTATCVWVLFM